MAEMKKIPMAEMKKITVDVPAETLEAARDDNAGVTETVGQAVERQTRALAWKRLLALQGQGKVRVHLGRIARKGMKAFAMGEMKKITVEVPIETLEAAMIDGRGLAETVREALKEFAHKRAYERLRAMRGKLDLGIDLEELREDREW